MKQVMQAIVNQIIIKYRMREKEGEGGLEQKKNIVKVRSVYGDTSL